VLAIDTNVVVRFLVADDPVQAAKARTLLETEAIQVSVTVMMETEWVLRSAYGFDRTALIGALESFAGLPNVTVQESDRVARALMWAAEGMDFADALHLGGAEGCEAFATFDRRMARSWSQADATPVRIL
jgi:predicted nucleic-acid-binding protein